MKKLIRTIRKIVFYTVFLCIILSSLGIFLAWYYAEPLKQRMVSQLNTYINTPIKVDYIDLELFEYFPFIALELQNVSITESLDGSSDDLAVLETFAVSFNPIDLIRGYYNIHSLDLINGKITLRNYPGNRVNYRILKENEESRKTDDSFQINKAQLNNVLVEMYDEDNDYSFSLITENVDLSLQYSENTVDVTSKGALKTFGVLVSGNNYLKDRSMDLNLSLKYYLKDQLLDVIDSEILINKSIFKLLGKANFEKKHLDFTLEGKDTNFQTLVSLLPDQSVEKLRSYNSKGSVFFDMNMIGYFKKGESLAVSSNFGFNNATIENSKNKIDLVNTSFDGSFSTSSLSNLQNAELNLKNFNATFNGDPIRGNIIIKNFEDPKIDCEIVGDFDLKSLAEFNNVEGYKDFKGSIHADFSIEGKISELKKYKRSGTINSSGELELINISFLPVDYGLPFTGWNGTLIFNSNSVAYNNLSGKIGTNSIEAQGRIVNLFSYLFDDKDPFLIVDSKVHSDNLFLDEILRDDQDESEEYSFNIQPGLKLKFDLSAGKLNYRKFTLNNVRGEAIVSNQVLELNQFEFEEIGGRVALDMNIDASGRMLDVITSFKTEEIYIDSLFYLFDNFNQKFLVKEHMKGQVSSTVSADMRLTKQLEFIPQSLIADIQLRIRDGELNNFEPIYVLQDYVPKEDLVNLKFAELSNSIHVENETVFIPEMEIESNVTTITIGGKHTFDQRIEYKIVAPLLIRDKVDPDEAFGAIEDDGSIPPNIHLLLYGTTDDYQIKFDKEGTKNEIIKDLKSEVKELKDAFTEKRKEKKKKLTLDEEDYFDW